MAKLLKLQLGVSDDPAAFAPSINDCLDAMLRHSGLLIADVLHGLANAASPTHARRVAGFQQPSMKLAIGILQGSADGVRTTFQQELTRLVYEGGGKEQLPTELLRFEDLQLFEDSDLDQSIEVARAQQEVMVAVDDELPTLDALMSTLLGWRTIQPGLNPLRPEVFVRALQFTLAQFVPDHDVREAMIAPAAGLLGGNLRRLYKEMSDWLRSAGVEPAVPMGGRSLKGSAAASPATDTVARTMLTLDKLRKLLAGDFDAKAAAPKDFLHTLPASFVALQDLKQVDAMVERLEQRKRTPASAAAPAPAPKPVNVQDGNGPRLGHQLGEEVVRLMFDNLAGDPRLMAQFKSQLRGIEPAVLDLARSDSRFFSDRTHAARLFLDRITQRSLGFASESDDGARRFLITVEDAVRELQTRPIIDADAFGEVLDRLQSDWTGHDKLLRQRREEAARALLHAEQRNLLAQKLAADFAQAIEGLDVADFVADFLRNSWAQVVAEAQLSCADGSDDPYGYRALVDDLIWSVQKSTSQRRRSRRLAEMIPGLLAKLREGLQRINYPEELTARFFDNLITIHEAALQEGRDANARAAGERSGSANDSPASIDIATGAAAGSGESVFPDSIDPGVWVGEQEAIDSGFLDEDSVPPAIESIDSGHDGSDAVAPAHAAELKTGTWVELMVNGGWTRVQLTWSSPHATLFMFTAQSGAAHSMSRRTLERLRSQGLMKVVAERNVIDEALDKVAKTALKNSLKPEG